MASDRAVELAAQVWCTEATKDVEMDTRLAAEFADVIDRQISEYDKLESMYQSCDLHRGRLMSENERLREELRNMVGPVTDELLKECGKREVGNWGIINNGLCSAAAALAAKGE